MKIVSFEVAKAIKEAGYPQGYFGHHYLFSGEFAYGALTEKDFEAPPILRCGFGYGEKRK